MSMRSLKRKVIKHQKGGVDGLRIEVSITRKGKSKKARKARQAPRKVAFYSGV